MQQHGSKRLLEYTPIGPRGGVKKLTHVFLKVVLLHIKLKGMEHRAQCKHIFCHNTHPQPWGVVKTFFLKEVMLPIKLKGMEHKAPLKHLFCPCTYHQHLGWVQKVKTFFSESSHVAY